MRLRTWFLLSLGATLACGTSDIPPGEDVPDGSVSVFPCPIPCPEGFACLDGACVPACTPGCPEGMACVGGACQVSVSSGPGEGALRNPCGGFEDIEGLPGTSCGPCETGRWLCETEDLVTCVDPIGLNACGTCGALPGMPGAQCGDERRWACTPEGGVSCVAWFGANPCLGTVALAEPPGRACGECGAGWSACDGNNATVCRVPTEVEPCACDPTTSRPLPCGTDTGICTRGLRFCGVDGSYGSCVQVAAGPTCATDADCPGATCVVERVEAVESIADGCVDGSEAACTRRVCRALVADRSCSSDADCTAAQACALGTCVAMVTRPIGELCNGIDDDCDGRIDNDERRTQICGSCPYNMMLVTNEAREFGRRRICIDIYEASRPDATIDDAGADDSYSASHWDRLPWSGATADDAVLACSGSLYNDQIPGGVAEKRLCVRDEWTLACNVLGQTYPYGDTYAPAVCNDASAGRRAPAPTSGFAECSHLVPDGRFPNFDFSGNVAEWVRVDEGVALAGGDFTSRPSEVTCASVAPARDPTDSVGFRCCAATVTVTSFDDED